MELWSPPPDTAIVPSNFEHFFAMKQKSVTNRVEAGGAGIGEVSDPMIARRARDLAAADGRDESNEADMREARLELAGRDEAAMAVEDTLAEGERADAGVAPADTGSRAPRLEMDDENNLAAEEVEEGIDEADLDTRKQSSPRV